MAGWIAKRSRDCRDRPGRGTATEPPTVPTPNERCPSDRADRRHAAALLVVVVGIALGVAWMTLSTGEGGDASGPGWAGAAQAGDHERANVREGSAVPDAVDAAGPRPEEVEVVHPVERTEVVAAEPAPDPGRINVAGTVVDLSGEPIEGVHVTVSIAVFPIYRRSKHARTDANGRYSVRNLFPGKLSLSFRKQGLCDVRVRPSEVSGGETVEVETVTMSAGTRVWGVLRVDGKPQSGVQIWAAGEKEAKVRGRSAIDSTTSKSEGKFEFPGRFRPGHYRVAVAPLYATGVMRSARWMVAEFDVAPGQVGHFLPIDVRSR